MPYAETIGGTTSATTTTSLIWTYWIEETNNSVTTSTSVIWNAWSSNYVVGGSGGHGYIHEQPTTEQVRQRIEASRLRQIQIDGERAEARKRAEMLLQQHLTEQQKEQLRQKNYFELDLLEGDKIKRYRIERKWAGSVHQVDPGNGQILKTLCIHPRIQTPVEDSMLAQKLMLESGNEAELLRIANVHFQRQTG